MYKKYSHLDESKIGNARLKSQAKRKFRESAFKRKEHAQHAPGLTGERLGRSGHRKVSRLSSETQTKKSLKIAKKVHEYSKKKK